MARNFENIPSEEDVQGEEFRPEDWLGTRNTRNIIHIGRKVLQRSVRGAIDRLNPLLAPNDGIGFFRQFAYDSEYRIFVANNPEIAGEDNTIITVNRLRSSNQYEPNFPDGRAVDLVDLVIPYTSNWANTAWETLYRGQHMHQWDTPECATLFRLKRNGIKLIGNIANNDFTPQPARDLQEVANDAEILWSINTALNLCDEISFEPQINHIIE